MPLLTAFLSWLFSQHLWVLWKLVLREKASSSNLIQVTKSNDSSLLFGESLTPLTNNSKPFPTAGIACTHYVCMHVCMYVCMYVHEVHSMFPRDLFKHPQCSLSLPLPQPCPPASFPVNPSLSHFPLSRSSLFPPSHCPFYFPGICSYSSLYTHI